MLNISDKDASKKNNFKRNRMIEYYKLEKYEQLILLGISMLE